LRIFIIQCMHPALHEPKFSHKSDGTFVPE